MLAYSDVRGLSNPVAGCAVLGQRRHDFGAPVQNRPRQRSWVLLADGATGRLTPALALTQLHAMTGGHPSAHAFARQLGASDSIAKTAMTARLHKLLAVVGI